MPQPPQPPQQPEDRRFRLVTLGRVALHAVDGEPVPAPQRKALALLALLATYEHEGCGRDKLTMLLWPDSDAEAGRHALAQCLYRLRRDLGTEVTSGNADLRLNFGCLATDVTDFLGAHRSGRLADAADLYGGDFLDGFYLRGNGDFERWRDARRDGFRRDYGFVLRRLADDARRSGDVSAELEWLRRLTHHEPLSSVVALAHMERLAAAGERESAIARATAYATSVRTELDADPDPFVMARADELRRQQSNDGDGHGAEPFWRRLIGRQ